MSLLASSSDDTPSNSSLTVSIPAEAARIFGETIADARRLLKQANKVFIFVRVTDTDHDNKRILVFSKQAFARSLKHERDSDIMPCELQGGTLLVGAAGAIYAARDAKEARDAASSQ